MTYVWDNLWAKVVLGMSDYVLGRSLLLDPVDYLLKNDVWVLTNLVNNIIDYVISGKKPYWQIPFRVVSQLFRE